MQVLGCIGAGCFGKVLKVRLGEDVFALKQIQLQFDSGSDSEQLLGLQREVQLLSRCMYHPNVVRCYSSFRKDDCFYIVMEYAGHRTLNDLVLPLQLPQLIHVLAQLALALKHLQANRIVHRDLKPTNVIISEKGLLKIADFGISRALGESGVARTVVGTPFYTAPQVLEQRFYDYGVDVWALGVMLFELVHGQLPFVAREMAELKHKIRWAVPQVRTDIHPQIRMILRGCLAKDPRNRMTVAQILRMPLLKTHMAQAERNTRYL